MECKNYRMEHYENCFFFEHCDQKELEGSFLGQYSQNVFVNQLNSEAAMTYNELAIKTTAFEVFPYIQEGSK